LIQDKRVSTNRYRWPVVVALFSLAVVLAIFASQLNLTEEPARLANLSPAEHFFVHVLFFLSGSVFGACVALMAVKAFPNLFTYKRRPKPMSTSGGARYPPG
jgi:Na+/H+ antiporter NhaD/arsenite permease-like protein